MKSFKVANWRILNDSCDKRLLDDKSLIHVKSNLARIRWPTFCPCDVIFRGDDVNNSIHVTSFQVVTQRQLIHSCDVIFRGFLNTTFSDDIVARSIKIRFWDIISRSYSKTNDLILVTSPVFSKNKVSVIFVSLRKSNVAIV